MSLDHTKIKNDGRLTCSTTASVDNLFKFAICSRASKCVYFKFWLLQIFFPTSVTLNNFQIKLKTLLVSHYKYGSFCPVTILVKSLTNPDNLTNNLLIFNSLLINKCHWVEYWSKVI